MIGVYAVAIVIGGLGALTWIVMSVAAGNVDDWGRYDPGVWGGRWARRTIAGLVGGGMAGMSATYAGWNTIAAVVAAAVGCVGLATASDWLTSTAENGSDSERSDP